jgi:rod shape determining protein RodA
MTIALYAALAVMGWLAICGAGYSYIDTDIWAFFDIGERTGKQAMWMGVSLLVGVVLMFIDKQSYEFSAKFIYVALILLGILTIFISKDIKGSRSWITIGSFGIQPAEFMKFGTTLTLAALMNKYGFSLQRKNDFFKCLAIILLPLVVIICQNETGSALVYLSFFLMLYREGMPGSILFTGICAVAYFVIGIGFSQELLPDGETYMGEFLVLSLIVIFTACLTHAYCGAQKAFKSILIYGGGAILLALLFSLYVVPFNVVWFLYIESFVLVLYLIVLSFKERMMHYFYIALFVMGSIGFLYSADYVFEEVLAPHQKERIEVLLGMEEDLDDAGYNVNQSKIAIGSGGLLGKGFLNGTQTKLKYVPEQDTDFIFCTVGEEQGFLGSALVLILFMALILRLISLAERQYSRFGRVYGYCVLSIFFFHLFINVGMVLGLTPVIGIPLPLFSYGGSSLWGFTILLFVFLRLDASRTVR